MSAANAVARFELYADELLRQVAEVREMVKNTPLGDQDEMVNRALEVCDNWIARIQAATTHRELELVDLEINEEA